MAHIEVWWRCPGCHRLWDTQREAAKCSADHIRAGHCAALPEAYAERWAVSDRHPGKAVACNYRGEAFALREADLSDFIEERRRELEEGR